MKEAIRRMSALIAAAVPRLEVMSAEESLEPYAPGKTWSRREVLGHLIDSAANIT